MGKHGGKASLSLESRHKSSEDHNDDQCLLDSESTTFDKGKASKIPSLPHKNEKNCILSVSTLSDLAEKAGTVIDATSAFVRVKDGIKELNTSELEIQKMKVVRRLLPRDVQISQVVNLQTVTNDILLGKNCSGICR
ncbi:hypothetical protein QAD02_020567 [Eretmocerus hayati]|uniref:Uncharacterized protein n=1 Tax=Eretmocerus hayati TaxID=131215 RepID=A0ACC2PMF8_9HYME|nr:hypothetical protein QAD02_020567 [Eretmocerus hayati]